MSSSFAFDLFKGSSWYLSHLNIESAIDLPRTEPILVHTVEAQPSACKVLFLGDTYNGIGEDLLQKMILAMNLSGNDTKRILFDEQNHDRLFFLESIAKYRPEVVVSLGAIVTNILLEKKEKLSSIHGQFIESNANNWKYLMMPLFHPEFLLINPNMKRTAWNDLQKIMELFKKDR